MYRPGAHKVAPRQPQAGARGAAGYAGKIIGMTGDPQGCSERDDFEAAGLNACVDKDSAGVGYIIAMLSEMKADWEEGGRGHVEDHAHGNLAAPHELRLADGADDDDARPGVWAGAEAGDAAAVSSSTDEEALLDT